MEKKQILQELDQHLQEAQYLAEKYKGSTGDDSFMCAIKELLGDIKIELKWVDAPQVGDTVKHNGKMAEIDCASKSRANIDYELVSVDDHKDFWRVNGTDGIEVIKKYVYTETK